LAAHLLAQFEQLGGGEPAAGGGLFALHFLTLRGPVGRHRIPDFVAAHFAHPEEITGDRQRGTAGENEKACEG
jgi:hypothetical protein